MGTGPSVYQGGTYLLYVDRDPEPGNANHLLATGGAFPNRTLEYSVDVSSVPAGTYYLYMTLDLGQGPFNVGYFGASPMPWDVPGAANAAVSCGARLNFNVWD